MNTQTTNQALVHQLECLYDDCHHKWTPRTDRTPAACPKCKRYNWMYPHGKNPNKKRGRKGNGGAVNEVGKKGAISTPAIDAFVRRQSKMTKSASVKS